MQVQNIFFIGPEFKVAGLGEGEQIAVAVVRAKEKRRGDKAVTGGVTVYMVVRHGGKEVEVDVGIFMRLEPREDECRGFSEVAAAGAAMAAQVVVEGDL